MSQPFVPRPWQPAMLDHIAEHPRCAVFAAMGSGKTAATLLATQGAMMLDEGPVLVLAPKRVAQTVWPSEAGKWDNIHQTVMSCVGGRWHRTRALKRKADAFSINYEQLPWLIEHFGDDWPFRTIIADESTRLKGFRLRQGGLRTRALGKVAWRPDVARFIELTGTPAPNGLKDLWGQMWFLDKGERLGKTYDAFTSRWFRPSWDGFGVEPFAHSQKEIQDKISDICITIDPRDHISLDETIEHIIEVEVPKEIIGKKGVHPRQIYDDMERQMFIELGSGVEVEAVHAAARTNKCLQIASGFVYHDGGEGFTVLHTAKLDALESIVEEANGAPILVSYQFKQELAMMRRRFPRLVTLDEAKLEDWNAGRVPLMAAHPASAGHGLNLQEGSNILVDYSSGWNLEYDLQLGERVGPLRQMQSGLNRPVYRYRIQAKDTVDELVKLRRETKRSVQSILLEAMKRAL